LLIAEQLMLLLLDAERGQLVVHRDDTDPDRLAAAAVLLDLAEQRTLGYRSGHLMFRSRFPSGHPVLAASSKVLDVIGPGLPLSSALELIETRVAPLSRELLEGLYRRDLLHRVRRPSWAPWARTYYPLRSLQGRNESLSVLQTGVHHASRLRGHGLLLLVDCAGRLVDFLDARAHAEATSILLALGHQQARSGSDEAFLGALRATLLAD